jgi:hypothetical protein
MLRFPFQVRGFRVANDRLSFYIKPEDGLALPKIMQRMKQVFAQYYNGLEGRTGHIWRDRYWSEILEGEPEEGAAGELGATGRVGPRRGRGSTLEGETEPRAPFFPLNPLFSSSRARLRWPEPPPPCQTLS